VFLERLSATLLEISGAGATTTAAIARYRSTGALVAVRGETNGAMMRAPVVGWAFGDDERRRAVGERLARATHGGRDAVEGAVAIAELAAAGLEGRLDVGGAWPAPGSSPMSYDARPTLDAIVHVLAHHREGAEAMRAAVRLGGDTDTVAALVGGLLGPGGGEIPWLDEVLLPDGERLDRLAEGLAALRLSAEASA